MRWSISVSSCSLHLSSRSMVRYCSEADCIWRKLCVTCSYSWRTVCTFVSKSDTSCSLIKRLPPRGAEPPVIVPAGSYKSPSLVTERTRTFGWKVTCLAVSAVSHTKKPPKTNFMACWTSRSQPTISRAKCRSPPAGMTFLACFTVFCEIVWSTILFNGMMVTRLRSWPFSSKALPVSSLSTTTKKRRPPAQTSKARWYSLKLGWMWKSFETTPFTLDLSKPLYGSA
mmetsp:Transcript_165769/g.532287  ORF Transcript_165769/g.532287 Transcript_165769/m.532287 type:complete len:227 (+) Transcript_165769:1575-2255(+)